MRSYEQPHLQGLENALGSLPVPDVFHTFWLALFVSMLVSTLTVVTQRWHQKYSWDKDVNGIQKVHKNPVPRTGGVALLIGILIVPVLSLSGNASWIQDVDGLGIFMLLVAALPAMLAGLFEDLTKRGSVKMRLCATFVSAGLAAWLLGATLPRLDFLGIDYLMGLLPVSVALTAFAVAGVTNSINIIDGFHGVAGGCVVMVLAGMGLLAWQAGDMFVTQLALVGIGAAIGFLLLNYPTGRLFMGDGGAYLLGFWVAEVAVLTIARNPQINTWQILAICAYPVMEVVFSMYRRKFVRKAAVGAPDRLHLHSLFYRRVSCLRIRRVKGKPWMCNATVALFVWTWTAIAAIAAVLVAQSIPVAVSLVLIQILAYMALYTRLVRGHWCRGLNPAVIFGWRAEQRIKEI